MAILYPFASSSSGNCTYVGTKESGILIDAGIGIRQFAAHLKEIQVSAKAIRGIFVTHEHTDHIKGLARIQRALKVPIYGSKGTLVALLEKGVLDPHGQLELIEDKPVDAGDLHIKAFKTSHDSRDSQCYRVDTPDQRTVCVCTDLGYVTQTVHKHLEESNLVFLESNYEKNMLLLGKYPQFLKRRIDGKRGHLSNEACASEIVALYSSGVDKFVLGHLSEENNLPDTAFESVVQRMSALDAEVGKDYLLHVAPKINNGKVIEV